MKDSLVSKMLLKLLEKKMEGGQSSRPMLPDFSNMRPPQKKRRTPTRAQLKALEEGRKILLINRKQSQK